MALGINTNVASINAQNQLSKSQSMNDQALERLSSGLRINSAKDDAAGLAISTRFESQINGLNQASRNANDGISLAQTAEGGLDEITNNLQRVRELAVQSANATNNDSDRQALNDEVQQRLEEIDRIASQTSFNGLNVLDGSLGGQDFQVGANVGQTIEVSLENGARTSQLGKLAEAELDFDNATANDGSDSTFSLQVGNNETVDITVSDGDDANDIAASIRDAGISELSDISAKNEQSSAFSDFVPTPGDGESTLDINDENVISVAEGETLGLDGAIEAINNRSADTGVTAERGGTNNDELVLVSEDGSDFSLTQSATAGGLTDFATDGSTENLTGQVDLQSAEDIRVDDSANDALISNVSGENTFAAEGSLEQVGVTDVEASNDAITRIDNALTSVNNIRSELGAVQNRFESTISNLDNNIENLEASNSRIKDADFAAESAKLSQSQVLQQAGISVLSQANQRPQQVLSLLQ